MGATDSAPFPIEPVSLRVGDLGASREFFENLFGLQPAHGVSQSPDSVVLTSPVPGSHRFAIRLTVNSVPIRLAGVHVELESTNELLDLYFLALLGGWPTGELRFRRGSLSTTITDPDGHLIEVEAHYNAASAGALPSGAASRLHRAVPGRTAGVIDWSDGDHEPRRCAPSPGRCGERHDRSVSPDRLAR